MRIVLDAMGSDNYPTPDVVGAVLAAREWDDTIILVGREEAIQQELAKPKEPERGHTVIADVFSAGLKYYTDHLSRQSEDKQ